MSTEAKRIRSFIAECHEDFGGDLARPTQNLVRGLENIYDQLADDHLNRYPFELLQNAHDACADMEDRSGRISFTWTDEALHVADNGQGFSGDNVEALCAVGNTTKKGALGSIGYKGIGFVSVYELTDTPQVITHHGVNFGFDRIDARARQQPPMLLPLLCHPSEFGSDRPIIEELMANGATTIIRLPFRPTDAPSESHRRLLEVMRPEALIFMPKIGQLEFHLGGEVETWSCKQMRRKKPDKGTFYKLCVAGRSSEWLMSRKSVPTPPEILETPGWSESERLEAAVAIPWSGNCPAPSSTNQGLYAYYPTEASLGSGFLVHGDFQVTSNRKQVVLASPITAIVKDLALDVATELFRAVAANGRRQAAAVLDLLGRVGPSGTGFPTILRSELFERLAEEPLVPARRGHTLRNPTDCLIFEFDEDLMSVERAGEFLDLTEQPSEFADPTRLSDQAFSALEELGSSPVQSRWVVDRIKPKRQNFPHVVGLLKEWHDQLNPHQSRSITKSLQARPVVLDVDGRWRRASETYFGGGLEGTVAEALDLSFVEHLEDPELFEFVRDSLGARVLDVRSVVERVAERSTTTGLSTLHDKLFEVLQWIWARDQDECLAALSDQQGRMDASGWDVFDEIDEEDLDQGNIAHAPLPLLHLPVRTANGKVSGRRPLGRGVYFPKPWDGSDVAEKFFGRFGRAEFLALKAPTDETTVARERGLLSALGVRTLPVIETHCNSRTLSDWQSYYGSIADRVSRNCPANGHPNSGVDFKIHLVELLEEVVTDPRKGSSIALLELLGSKALLDEMPTDSVACGHGQHTKADSVTSKNGYMSWLLSQRSWVPRGRLFLAPRECWSGLPKRKTRLKLPEAPPGLSKTKGVSTCNYDNPGIDGLLSALRLLSKGNEEPDADATYTADWLTRHLSQQNTLPAEGLVFLAHSPEGRVWVDCSNDLLVWDLPGFQESIPQMSAPVLFDIEEETDLSSLASPGVASLASKSLQVQASFSHESNNEPQLTNDQVCGIVDQSPRKLKEYVATCLTSISWRNGEGLELRILDGEAIVASVGNTAAFLSVTDDPDSEPNHGDLPDIFARLLSDFEAPEEPRPGELTMYVDLTASREVRREGIADELLRVFPPDSRGDMGPKIELILTSSKKRWMKRLKVDGQGLSDARELVVMAAQPSGDADNSSIDTSSMTALEEVSEDESPAINGKDEGVGASVTGLDPPAPESSEVGEESSDPHREMVATSQTQDVIGDRPIRFPDPSTPGEWADVVDPIEAPRRRAQSSSAPASPTVASQEFAEDSEPPVDWPESEEASTQSAMLALREMGAAPDIRDVRTLNRGWDLECELDGKTLFVEVKSSRQRMDFALTNNEVKKLVDLGDQYIIVFVPNVSDDVHDVRIIEGLHQVAEDFAVGNYKVPRRQWEPFETKKLHLKTMPVQRT